MKQNIEIDLKPGVDPFAVQSFLNRYRQVKCNVVTLSKVRIWFNEDRISLKRILKLVAAASNPDKRTRKANIVHIKDLEDDQAA